MMELLGYAFTAVISFSLLGFLFSIYLNRKELKETLSKHIDKYTLGALLAILAVFLVIAIFFMHPVEQLYFDENIYQGIALNILNHANALWCQTGTAYFKTCTDNLIYHDPVEWSFFLAIGFAIFGVGISTAYAMQLFAGVLSIIFTFILASLLLKESKRIIASTTVFALMPELFIWSRTQAVPDLPFMTFTTMTFVAFVFFTKKTNLKSFLLFAFSLLLAVYIRIEGILLIGIFSLLYFVLGESGLKETFLSRIKLLGEHVNTNVPLLMSLLLFGVFLLPQIFYVSIQLSSLSYGQSFTGQKAFSIENFKTNSVANIEFLAGAFNSISQYPMAFPPIISLLAVLGILLFLLTKNKNRFGMVIALLLWFLVYQLFYDFFYAGAATFGVDVRFMLYLLPAISIFAGIAIGEASEKAISLANKISIFTKNRHLSNKFVVSLFSLLLIVLVIYPFTTFIPNITIKTHDMPQQTVILNAANFFYENYNKVPNNCLVFTFTPDLWAEFNRSSTAIGNINTNDQKTLAFFKNYKCFVIDYGYWCVVPPYHDSTCRDLLNNYKLMPLATNAIQGSANNSRPAFYQIQNYTNGG